MDTTQDVLQMNQIDEWLVLSSISFGMGQHFWADKTLFQILAVERVAYFKT